MNITTDKAIMLCQLKRTSLASNKWINTLNIKEELPPFEFKLRYHC